MHCRFFLIAATVLHFFQITARLRL